MTLSPSGSRTLRAAVALALIMVSNSLADPGSRSYPLPKHGALDLLVPAEWRDSVGQPPGEIPPTVEFRPTSGATFKVLLTPMWVMNPDGHLPKGEELKQLVQRAADHVAQRSVELAPALRELTSNSGKGFYFSATDKAPKAGEFKYLTQGVYTVGDLLVTFSILTNDGQEGVVTAALTMLASASQRK